MGPVNDFAGATTDPQLTERRMVVELADREGRPAPQTGTPLKFRENPAGVRSPIPALGAQTRAVLEELGYAEAEIDELLDTGTAYDSTAATPG